MSAVKQRSGNVPTFDVPDVRQLPTFSPPNYTSKDLLSAIPKHCFERSALKSSAYTVAELSVIAALVYAATFIDPSFGRDGNVLGGATGVFAKWAAWSAYWVLQGMLCTGIWIIAHECGHQAFSTSKRLNNSVGLVLHSALLVPYHSWRISHARHHAATGHLTRDEIFVPRSRTQMGIKEGGNKKSKSSSTGEMLDELLEDVPLYRLIDIVLQQLFGWPLYLFKNASGQLHYPPGTNHFDPSSIIFSPHHRSQVLLSDAALLVVVTILQQLGSAYGYANLVKFYFIPYLMVNHWLVMITYLQHTDPMLPHYRASEWTFPRGALCTIDRKLLGPVGPYIMHGICETHVSHHICSKIPHYHAWEATEALKSFLGEHYHSTDENMFVSLFRSFRYCRFVEDDDSICFYKDAHGQAQRVAVLASDSGVEMESGTEEKFDERFDGDN